MPKLQLASWQLSLIVATFIVSTGSTEFFTLLVNVLDLTTPSGIWLLATIAMSMILVLCTLIETVGIGRAQKPVIVFFLISSSVFGYFTNQMGIAFDKGMFRNIASTVIDQNVAEATELMSLPLLEHMLVLGIIPALLLSFVDISRRRFLYEAGARICILIVATAILAGIMLPNFKEMSFVAVEHRDFRFKIIPLYPLVSMFRLIGDGVHESRPFRNIDKDAYQRHVSKRRTLGIMVVGETARADHFSLLGYGKRTNPDLESTEGLLIAHGDSCGTSTLFAVPCMFSMREHDDFSPDVARSESSVLDILNTAGVRIAWIDNNSGCQHVCDRLDYLNIRQQLNSSSPYYSEQGFYDEALLQYVDEYLDRPENDMLLVLHMLGSHGPAYSRRYPTDFGFFSPSCEKASPNKCSTEEVLNAYDNTILYTDHILRQLIDSLQSRQDNADVFLMYVSDHGESLGENGLFLHGMPYRIAPPAQTDVPFVIWFSHAYREHHRIDDDVAREIEHARLSHDNISHTLLGLFDVDASSYRWEKDIFARDPGSQVSHIPSGGVWSPVAGSD